MCDSFLTEHRLLLAKGVSKAECGGTDFGHISIARDEFVTTAMMFVRLSVCLSVWDGRALHCD